MPTCNGCVRNSLASVLPPHTASLTVNARRSQNFIRHAFLDWERQRVARIAADRGHLSRSTSNGSQASRDFQSSTIPSIAYQGVCLQAIPTGVHSVPGVNSSAAADTFQGGDVEEMDSSVHTIPGVSPASGSEAFPGVNLEEIPSRVHTLPGVTN